MTTENDSGIDPPETPEEVLALLRAEIPLYEKLESYASRQRSCITKDDTGLLLSLLADRQKISTELARLTARLEPVRRNWSCCRERFAPAQRDEADRLLTEIHGHLKRVMESDEEDARLLVARKKAAADVLQATHSTGRAVSAYRVPTAAKDSLTRCDEAT
jgi:hypothetical protein